MYLLIKELEELVTIQDPQPEHFRRLAQAVLDLANLRQNEVRDHNMGNKMLRPE